MAARLAIPLAAGALALAAAAASGQPTPISGAIERGAQVAQARCAVCHAVAMEARSPNRDAPLFRVLSRLYSAKDITARMADIAEYGHFEMPPLEIREDEIEDVAAYIQSLDGGAAPQRPPETPAS